MAESNRPIVVAIVIGLVLWGLGLAVGATYFYEPGHPQYRRGALVAGCTLGFVATWLLLMRWRGRGGRD